MTYRITQNINLPFLIKPSVSEFYDERTGKEKIDAQIQLKSIFDQTIFATNLTLKFPCPKNTASVRTNCALGRAKYEPDQQAVVWRIKKFLGGNNSEQNLRIEIDLVKTTERKPWMKPPISMDFQVPMFPASGLRVRFLKVFEKSGYKPTKWIRYITKAGDYQRRLA